MIILQEWEITAASEKLAECQETILNLGKQLKALAAPNEASLFDKAIAAQCNRTIPTTKPQKVKNRASLLDQMLAEDDTKSKSLKAPRTIDGNPIITTTTTSTTAAVTGTMIPGISEPLEKILGLNGFNSRHESDVVSSLDIVPTKKRSGSLWKKLLWRKKVSTSMKLKRP